MSRKLSLLLGSALIIGGPVLASGQDDPSSAPARDSDGKYVERYRFRADFNRDGVLDLAVSVPLPMFGQAGGSFSLYLVRADGIYDRAGELFLHPRAISMETVHERTNLWTYARASGSEGRLGYYALSKANSGDSGLAIADFVGVTVHPGDGGTELGRKLYTTVFSGPHRVPVERSTTEDGVPRWSPWPHGR